MVASKWEFALSQPYPHADTIAIRKWRHERDPHLRELPLIIRSRFARIATMNDTFNVTIWLNRLRTDDRSEAVTRLWAVYFHRMVRLAHQRLGQRTRAVEGEDVAVAAFDSFVRATTAGRFPRLHDRDDLWRILFTLTVRKAADAIEAEQRLKRGGGLAPIGDVNHLPSDEPDPAEAAAIAESVERLLAMLSVELRTIAAAKLEGYTNAEIGEQIGRTEVTVERKLRLIRELWKDARER